MPTLEDFVARYIEGHARANKHKASGIATKERIFRLYLAPQLGKKKLDAVSDDGADPILTPG